MCTVSTNYAWSLHVYRASGCPETIHIHVYVAYTYARIRIQVYTYRVLTYISMLKALACGVREDHRAPLTPEGKSFAKMPLLDPPPLPQGVP